MAGIDYGVVSAASDERPRSDSASLVELPDGSLFITYMEFSEGDQQGRDTGLSRIVSRASRDGGLTWTNRQVHYEPEPGDDINAYNPSVLRLRDGSFLFFHLRYNALEWSKPLESTGYLARSTDDCVTFGEPRILWRREPFTSMNNTLLELSTGRIVKPVHRSAIWGGPRSNSKSSCLRSDDGGVTWDRPRSWIELPLRGNTGASIAELGGGRLLMSMRTQLGSVFFSRSEDGGERWGPAQTSGLRAPESPPFLSRIPQTGDLLIVWNNSLYDPGFNHFGMRTPLTCAISRDEGRTWTCIKNIEDDPEGVFCNTACDFTTRGSVMISYMASRMQDSTPPGKFGATGMSLKVAAVDIDWLYR